MARKSKLNFPTILTLMRIILVGPLMIFMFMDGIGFKIAALICFIIASVTDFIDGRMARKNNQVTDLGAFLDPLADKMLVNLTIFSLCMCGMLDPWFFGIILVRDFAVDGMRMMVAKTGETVSASIWGKAKTMTQMIFLCIVIFETILCSDWKIVFNLSEGFFIFLKNFNITFEVIVLFLTTFSGYQYLRDGLKKAIK